MKALLRKATHFQNWRISTKIMVTCILITCLLGGMVMFIFLPQVEQKIWSDKIQATRNLTEEGYAVMAAYGDRVEKGELKIDEAKRRVLEAIGAIRYDGNNYLWINDLHPTMVHHPTSPELNGKDLSTYLDPQGKAMFVEMVNVCKRDGEGTVEYTWRSSTSASADPKISYVKLYKPWGWIVGTGVYTDDVNKEIAAKRLATGIATLLAALLSTLLAVLVGKAISRPMQAVVSQMDNADLNTRFNTSRQDEIGQLQRSFDRFVGSISATLLQVSEATSVVASASTEISSSTEQMAAGAHEQTSQAGEVASAVEQMIRTIVENSRNSSAAAETAMQAKAAAEQGGAVVGDTVAGMKRIAEVVITSAATVEGLGKSSDQIGEIISVIDDIADQTNLLALNAAIEAARAGEQGRGFAVVADEVRKLAERTTSATKEIATMIRKIQTETAEAVKSMQEGTSEVQRGILSADKASASLKDIVLGSQRVTDMVTQIATASEEQSSASEQISKNVAAISTVTGETASATQQIARAAEDLNRLTENLQQLVSRFALADREVALKGPKSLLQDDKSTMAVQANGTLIRKA
jgi:methyl-accepting chemotaxis protein